MNVAAFLAFMFAMLAAGFFFGTAYGVREHQREDADRARRLERGYRNASR